MLPVGVAVDVVHVALGVQAERPEDDRAGDKGAAAEIVSDVGPHAVEVGLLRLGEEDHAVESARPAFALLEKADVARGERLTLGQDRLSAGPKFHAGEVERRCVTAEREADPRVDVAGGRHESEAELLPFRAEVRLPAQAQVAPWIVGLADIRRNLSRLLARRLEGQRVVLPLRYRQDRPG